MKKFKKIFCLTLAVLMLVLPLSACESSSSITTESSFSYFEGDDVQVDTQQQAGTTSTGNKNNNKNKDKNKDKNNNNKKDDPTIDEFEDINLKGESIRIAATWGHGPSKTPKTTADKLQRKRIAELEKKYNCKFEFNVFASGYGDRLKTSVAAGKPFADFIVMYTATLPTNAYAGYLQNLDEIKAMDLTDNKWNLGAVSNGAFNGGHYSFAIGSTAPRYVLAFNKTLFEKNGWTLPYELYYQNKWNWDECMKLAQKATDANAQRYGIGGIEIGGSSIIASFGGDVITIDSKGKPSFAGDSAECQQAIAFQSQLKTKYKDCIWRPSSYTWATFINGLQEGQVAMAITQMYLIRENILKMKDDYGIVPIPKGTNAKGRYASVQDNIPTYVMLANNPLKQEKGYILHLYTEPFEGQPDVVSKAQLETYCRDDESVKILLDVEKNYGHFLYSTWFTDASGLYADATGDVIDGTATFSEAMGKYKNQIVQKMNDTYNSWNK